MLLYGLGALSFGDLAWFCDLRSWWLTAMLIVFTGLIYYQTRHNIDEQSAPVRRRRPLTGSRLRVLHVTLSLAFMLLAAGCAVAGIALLASGRNAADSGAGVLLAFAPIMLAVPVLLGILAVRGAASVRTQWVVVLCGLAAGAMVLIVFGITAEDAGKLLGYGIACTAAAAGAGGAAARSGRS